MTRNLSRARVAVYDPSSQHHQPTGSAIFILVIPYIGASRRLYLNLATRDQTETVTGETALKPPPAAGRHARCHPQRPDPLYDRTLRRARTRA